MTLRVYKFNQVKSTNDIAINFIQDKGIKKGIIVANTQSKGRGTKGKKWISLKGNLFLSIFFPIKNIHPKFYEFTIINPVLIISAISKFYKKRNLQIKWPNDILIGNKKVCGILQEIVNFKEKSYIIIGIGINLNSSPLIRNKLTTSIYLETKKLVNKDNFLRYIKETYNNFFLDLETYDFSFYKDKSKSLSVN